MKYQLFAAGAALAPLAAATNIDRREFSLNLPKIVYVTEVKVVTVVETVFGDAPQATTASLVPTSTIAAIQTPVDSQPVVAEPAPAANPINADSISAEASSSFSVPAANKVITSNSQPSTPSTASTHAAASTTKAVKSTATGTTKSNQAPASSSNNSGQNITSSLSPRGKKAGLSGYVGIQQAQAFKDLSPYISWYSDYTANTPSSGNVMGVGMLWAAAGSGCGSIATSRTKAFNTFVADNTPEIMFGFYEPDCNCPDSSSMSVGQGQAAWNSLMAPLKKKGTILGSPSMCKQKDENWLTPFKSNIDADWDVTSVHINKPDIAGVKQDIEYYASTYGKKIWVSEFACVNDHDTWQPCTDQAQINQFIKDCVEFFQGNDTVVAYGPSNGNGLGNTWPLTTTGGSLSESGQTYLNAIKNL